MHFHYWPECCSAAARREREGESLCFNKRLKRCKRYNNVSHNSPHSAWLGKCWTSVYVCRKPTGFFHSGGWNKVCVTTRFEVKVMWAWFFKWQTNTHKMFNTEKYFYTQLFCSKTSSCICDKVCGSQSYKILWGRHQTLPPSPSLLIIIVIYFIFLKSGTWWLQRSFLKFQMHRKILFSETVRKKAPVRGGSEQMEGTWRANRKWRLGGFLMLCWQQSKFHFPLLTLPTGAVSVCLFPPFIWHVAFWPQKLF